MRPSDSCLMPKCKPKKKIVKAIVHLLCNKVYAHFCYMPHFVTFSSCAKHIYEFLTRQIRGSFFFFLQLITPSFLYFLELISISLKLWELFLLTLYILLTCHFTASMNSMSLIYYMCFTICFDQERNIWVAYNQDILLTLHISTYLHMILFNILLIIVYKFLHINLHMFHSLNYLHVRKLLFSLMHYF